MQESGQPPKSYSLATGVSETLKVQPARRLLNIMMTGKHGAAKKVGNVINLHFEGNWMPIQVQHLCLRVFWSCPLLKRLLSNKHQLHQCSIRRIRTSC